jgi:hypothetical protein
MEVSAQAVFKGAKVLIFGGMAKGNGIITLK